MDCKQLEAQIQGLEAEKDYLQNQLHEGGQGGGKASINQQINAINKALKPLKKKFQACLPKAGL
jgi:flagellar biosynthesis chaperone FliJ